MDDYGKVTVGTATGIAEICDQLARQHKQAQSGCLYGRLRVEIEYRAGKIAVVTSGTEVTGRPA